MRRIMLWVCIATLIAPISVAEESALWNRIRDTYLLQRAKDHETNKDPNASRDARRKAIQQALADLGADDFLIAARQVCAQMRTKYPSEEDVYMFSMEWLAICLDLYPEKALDEDGYQTLLGVLRKKGEDKALKRFLVYCFSASSFRIAKYLSDGVETHRKEVMTVLSQILNESSDSIGLRGEAIATRYHLLRYTYLMVFRQDPAVQDKFREGGKLVFPYQDAISFEKLESTTRAKLVNVDAEIAQFISELEVILDSDDLRVGLVPRITRTLELLKAEFPDSNADKVNRLWAKITALK